MTRTKKNLIVTAVAVMLAVVMLLGGATYTYLSSTSNTVKNKFNTNEIDIEIDETTGEEYEILPGTSEEKDPVVSGTFTVDSYLYVLVYGNNPTLPSGESYIEWAVADGWSVWEVGGTELSSLTDTEKEEILGYFGLTTSDVDWESEVICILYRDVEASDVEQEFHILDGDKVTYNSAITSEDLEGYSDGDIYLSFAGYAIQQKPFNTAYDALLQTTVTTANGLTTTLSTTGSVTLSAAVSLSSSDLQSAIDAAALITTDLSIDLNGSTLTVDGGATITVPEGCTLTIENGSLETTGYASAASGLTVSEGSTLTLNNVEYEGASISVLQDVDDVEVNIINSSVTGTNGYALATNASTATANDPSNVVINIKNSELVSVLNEPNNNAPEVAAVLINIPATVTITDSIITGGSQGLIMRGGTATVTNTVITAAMTGYDTDATPFSTTTGYYDGAKWGSGNSLPAAALIVGNNSNSNYAYNTTVTLDNVTLVVGEGTDVVPSIYIANSNGYTTSLTGADDSDTVLSYYGSGSSSLNGTALTSSNTTMTTVKALTTTVASAD